MDLIQIATLAGVALGSAISTYQVSKKRVGREHTAQLAVLRRQVAELRERKLPTLSDERVREIVESALKDYVTMEEFNAYASLDSERRGLLIEKIGELKGTVAALLQRR